MQNKLLMILLMQNKILMVFLSFGYCTVFYCIWPESMCYKFESSFYAGELFGQCSVRWILFWLALFPLCILTLETEEKLFIFSYILLFLSDIKNNILNVLLHLYISANPYFCWQPELNLDRLRMAVDDLLVKLARTFPKTKQQTIFLMNNYDMTIAVLKVDISSLYFVHHHRYFW